MQVEKLLLELQSMPEEGPQVPQADRNDGLRRAYSNVNLGEEQGASLEETRSRLLERIASEMNRLKFYVARAQVCWPWVLSSMYFSQYKGHLLYHNA
jgi:hypothetical protein